MKFLILPDKFKGSMSAFEVADAIEIGIKQIIPNSQIRKIPLADGGDGSLEILKEKLSLRKRSLSVSDPLFNKVKTDYFHNEESVFIELAQASGLQLLNEKQRNPMNTTTFGTGEILRDAINIGFNDINLFIGGSATNDFGIGIASALGYDFLDHAGKSLMPIGKHLIGIKKIIQPKTIKNKFQIKVLTDVKSPLYGKFGAAHLYAEQKGASPNEIEILDKGLKNIAKIVRSEFHLDVSKIPGSGAAGGVGGGMVAFFKADLRNGIDEIIKLLNIDNYIRDVDFIITGEGKLDSQTLNGKVVNGIIDLCKKYNKPLGIICGQSTLKADEIKKINAIVKPIMIEGISQNEALINSKELIIKRSVEMIKNFIN